MDRLYRLLSQRWPWFTAAGLVVLAFLSTLVEFSWVPTDDRPVGSAADIEALRERDDINVLFILVDTLRADHLGAWGYERDTSPVLDKMASSGVRFAHQVAQSSWTKCSMASLWTGLYPSRTGVTRFEHVVSPEARLPAEILSDAGFRTAGLFRNGWVDSSFGFDQGFQVYAKPRGRPAPASVYRENPTIKESGTDLDAVEASVEFLRVFGKERWFLYLHLMDLHEYIYDEDSALFGTDYEDIYDNSILRENLVLGKLFEALTRGGYLENTLIILASDHGEAFSERGFEGHARYVYRETTHVPLILGFPFKFEPGVVVESITRNIDIWPTVLDLLGLPPMDRADGRSLRPEILAAARGEAPAPMTEPAYAHLDRTWGQREAPSAPTLSLVEEKYRYVRIPKAFGERKEQLFDRENDAHELTNIGPQNRETLERMSALADTYLESEVFWEEGVPSLELDEIQLNQLRALGYQVP